MPRHQVQWPSYDPDGDGGVVSFAMEYEGADVVILHDRDNRTLIKKLMGPTWGPPGANGT